MEQGPKVRGCRGEQAAGGEEVGSVRVADQAGEEERRTRLHGEAATGEDEAVLGSGAADTNRRGEGHRHAEADGGALHGCDSGFAAAVDGEGETAAAGGNY